MIDKMIPYVVAFATALVVTLILTPVIRETNRRLGMVDKPDPRRINKVPIPRGGGLALFFGVLVSFLGLLFFYGDAVLLIPEAKFYQLTALGAATVALGYVDDKFSLNPKVKLLGQLIVAFLTWSWADLGFNDLWPSIPVWLDCAVTVFWITGAINAFNLIDGLDGLASGLALIASVGMASCLMVSGHAHGTLFYFAFAGGLLGFLRYNYNPASVFLGDSGSMFIGFTLSVLPLCSHAPNSFLVSVGVPMLAMGVPIFDTSLAIFRRSIRRFLNVNSEAKEGQVMQADIDHLHHRILRQVGLNQRKAVWTLYGLTILLVAIGLCGLLLRNRSTGLWIVAVIVISVIVFRDAARIELFDTGRLLDTLAHDRNESSHRRWARLAVPFYVLADLAILSAVFFGVTIVLDKPLFVRRVLLIALPVRVLSIFCFMAAFGIYRTVWSRALLSNYIRLFLACALGSLIGTALIYYLPDISGEKLMTGTILYALLPFFLFMGLRVMRNFLRDMFYHVTTLRLKGRKDVSRILVYGTGLRYRAFRRELVRVAATGTRVIVGLIDDDLILRHHYIGGVQVKGSLDDIPEVVNELNVDAVVIAFDASDERIAKIAETLKPLGVKVTHFGFVEDTF